MDLQKAFACNSFFTISIFDNDSMSAKTTDFITLSSADLVCTRNTEMTLQMSYIIKFSHELTGLLQFPITIRLPKIQNVNLGHIDY